VSLCLIEKVMLCVGALIQMSSFRMLCTESNRSSVYMLSLANLCLEQRIAFMNKSPYKKQIPWPLVRKRTIPTELPPLVDEI
jgi:hypothetical protein